MGESHRTSQGHGSQGQSTLFAEKHGLIVEIPTPIMVNLYITSAMTKPSPVCEPLAGTYPSQSQQIIHSVQSGHPGSPTKVRPPEDQKPPLIRPGPLGHLSLR